MSSVDHHFNNPSVVEAHTHERVEGTLFCHEDWIVVGTDGSGLPDDVSDDIESTVGIEYLVVTHAIQVGDVFFDRLAGYLELVCELHQALFVPGSL